ncbi:MULTISPECIES: DUF305 domain-containing protein [Nocardia]|uniref:DUF305 domain-containing protein n=1 Tax=Nocardia TaxID=1817 RepID=UPI0002E03E46|nr:MULTISPECIES: DUF305 domain-containing protein [Nocardia]
MSKKTLASAVLAILASAAVLSGCSDDDSAGGHNGHTDTAATATAPASTGSGTVTGAHNDADVAFAREMIPHHRQAVEMAAMAPSRSTNPEVLELAAQIQAAQDPEIATMTGWLQSWGASATPTTGGGMDHGGMPMTPGSMPMTSGAMPGMMSDEQMAQMRGATGAEFDRMWLTAMIAHHQGAIEMARTELGAGADPEAKALAQRIIDAQQSEITRMQGLLAG